MPILLNNYFIFALEIVPNNQLFILFMENFKFDLTQEQVKLLATILSNYVLIVSRIKIAHPSIGSECVLGEILALSHELSIQYQKYYGTRD